jgi:hypothetical protein
VESARARWRTHEEILEVDPVTGRRSEFVPLARRALRALRAADVRFAVIDSLA